MQFPMLQRPRQLCPAPSSALPVPVRARSPHLGREGGEGPGHPARRWLPEDTLHFSAIYRVYPQPLRTELASLNYLGGVRCSQAARAVVGRAPDGVGGVGRRRGHGAAFGVSSWTGELTVLQFPQNAGEHRPCSPPAHPCPTKLSFSPSSEVPVPQSHRIPRQQ